MIARYAQLTSEFGVCSHVLQMWVCLATQSSEGDCSFANAPTSATKEESLKIINPIDKINEY